MRRLVAIAAAAVAAACLLAGLVFALPAQDEVDPQLEYGYVYSGVKSESVPFTAAASHDDTYYLFGSSELDTIPELVSVLPDIVFQNYDCDAQFMYLGEAYDQSLWMAIAAGAYADVMPNKELGIIVSLQWFEDGGLEPGIFKMRFSYPLYQAFCENAAISDETKAYVERRLAEEGVDQALIDAGTKRMPQDVVNAAVFGFMNDLRLRNSLQEVREMGTPRRATDDDEAQGNLPDFDALRQQVPAEADPACANNIYHVYNEYWVANLEENFEASAGEMSGETLSDTPEYDDLACFLDICRECGLRPYVIIMPVNGGWYDHVGLDRDVRADCYNRIRQLCTDAQAECLDLSPYEYEPYYLQDIMHLGWYGWLDVEEGFLAFVHGNASAQDAGSEAGNGDAAATAAEAAAAAAPEPAPEGDTA